MSTQNEFPPASPFVSAPRESPRADVCAHILVVEDESSLRDVLAEMLRRAGYRTMCAGDGEAGWDALCANIFDLVITDHDMPRLTGVDLMRRVRARPPGLPVILISGNQPSHIRDLDALLRPGLLMEKPFSLFELLTNVRMLLQRSKVVL